MYRWILAGLVLGAGLLTASAYRDGRAAPDDKPANATPADKAYAALLKDLDDAAESAETDAALEKLRATFAPRFLAHAKAHPGDATAVDALLLTVRMSKPGADGPRKGALALLNKDYAKTPHLSKAVFKGLAGSFFDPDLAAYLAAVAKDNPDKTIRALANKSLATGRERALEFLATLGKKAELRRALEEELGGAFVKAFVASKAELEKQKAAALAALRGELKGVIPDTMAGAAAPDAVAADLKGNKVSLGDLKGQVVVVDFWGTFCPPCRKMIPDSQKLVKAMKGRPFAFVSVSADEEKSTLTAFLKEHDMPWHHWWVGADSKFQEAWDVEGFPTVFVVDHKGVIRYSQVGYDPENKLEKEVEKLVGEAEKDKK